METPSAGNDRKDPVQAVAYITSAHAILKALHEEIGRHPEIGAAITKLEMALNLLAVETGGLL
jgi:hypothetical protein